MTTAGMPITTATRVRAAIRLLRPHQWSKNVLVFAGLLFAKDRHDAQSLTLAITAFVAMSLVSSTIYVLNDLLDVGRDRLHPVKRNRPIASGVVSTQLAVALLIACLACGAGLSLALPRAAQAVILIYVAMQIAYNFGLKRTPIADVFCIASGFVLRAALGAAAIGAEISGWLLLCTGALALLVGFGKRRHEFVLMGEGRGQSRESLGGYTLEALNGMILTAAASAMMCYGIYAMESPTAKLHPALILTTLFVAYGIYRYLLLLFGQDEGGEPEMLFVRDRHMIAALVGFVLTAVLAMSIHGVPMLDQGGK